MSSRTLLLAEQLISRPSVTPEDAHCQKLVMERLKPLGFVFESLDSGPDTFRVSNLWAVRKVWPDATATPSTDTPKLLVFAGHRLLTRKVSGPLSSDSNTKPSGFGAP